MSYAVKPQIVCRWKSTIETNRIVRIVVQDSMRKRLLRSLFCSYRSKMTIEYICLYKYQGVNTKLIAHHTNLYAEQLLLIVPLSNDPVIGFVSTTFSVKFKTLAINFTIFASKPIKSLDRFSCRTIFKAVVSRSRPTYNGHL